MRRIYAVFAGSLAVMGSVLISGVAGGKTPSGSSLNATITVYDTDATGARTHIGSDDYSGSGSAVYSNVQDNSLVTYVFNGTLFLNLYSQSLRTLYINADDPVPGSPSGPAPGQYWQDVEFYISCYDATGTQVPLQNITASSGNCRVGVDFYSAGRSTNSTWGRFNRRLDLQPDGRMSSAIPLPEASVSTGPLHRTCLARTQLSRTFTTTPKAAS